MRDRLVALVEKHLASLDPDAAVTWRRDDLSVEAALALDGLERCHGSVPLGSEPVAAAARILDLFQDVVIEDAGGAPLPPCPVAGHPHPAAIRPSGDGLAWACPLRR